MGKTRRGDKEYNKEQKLSHENKRLKREISHLRKQLARLDLDRYSQVKQIIQEHYKHEENENNAELLESLKNEWKCWDCRAGYLEIVLYTKSDGTWYFRKCTHCEKRTGSKFYNPKVKGIVKSKE